jgi:hypothetical protein
MAVGGSVLTCARSKSQKPSDSLMIRPYVEASIATSKRIITKMTNENRMT